MMNSVLIITGDATTAKTLGEVLGNAGGSPFVVQWAKDLAEGVRCIRAGGIDSIMADLSLSDSQGIETFDALFTVAPHIPILVLCPEENEMLTTAAVQRGAQGYLAKAHFGGYLVPQSLRNMMQRKAAEENFFIEKNRAEITLNSISDVVVGTDMAGNVVYLNVASSGPRLLF